MNSLLILLTTILAIAGMGEASLRKQGNQVDPWSNLRDWNHDMDNHDHGRQLVFSDFQSCFEQTKSAALCSCIFIDGNDIQYCSVCGGSLLAAEFSLDDTSKFGNWFNDESKLNLAQTGSYTGIAGITEYVNFIYSVFFDTYELVEPFGIKFVPNDNFANDGVCIVTLAVHRRIALPNEFYDDDCIRMLAGNTIYYTAATPENGYIDVARSDVFYSSAFFEAFFGNMKEEETIDWLCNTVYDNCPSIWELNGFDNNPQKCVNNYKTLPRTQGEYDSIDGRALGCKVLHGTFVSLNPFHCAHISFAKQDDPSGVIKCQKSSGKGPEDFFSEVELDFFMTTAIDKYGFDATLVDTSNDQCA